ncbi:MAG: DUF5615 family PIN-like protein [Candidatus Bipolaricaulia bacterium]
MKPGEPEPVKLLIDVGVGKAVEDWLRSQGHDVVAVRDLDPRMADVDILKQAVQERRLILTMDKDFGKLVYHSRQHHAGVLLLRLEEARSEEKVAVIREIFERYEQELPDRGDVAVVVEHLSGTSATHGEDGYALEIFTAVGETIDVVMVPASAVKPLTEDEILQVRPLSPIH